MARRMACDVTLRNGIPTRVLDGHSGFLADGPELHREMAHLARLESYLAPGEREARTGLPSVMRAISKTVPVAQVPVNRPQGFSSNTRTPGDRDVKCVHEVRQPLARPGSERS